jgi:hypothetical protein
VIQHATIQRATSAGATARVIVRSFAGASCVAPGPDSGGAVGRRRTPLTASDVRAGTAPYAVRCGIPYPSAP